MGMTWRARMRRILIPRCLLLLFLQLPLLLMCFSAISFFCVSQDQQIADNAIKTLQEVAADAKSGKRPFFVAVGFHRPHLPWVVPHEFLELYPLDQIKLPHNPYAPVGMPQVRQPKKHARWNLVSKVTLNYVESGIKRLLLPYFRLLGLTLTSFARTRMWSWSMVMVTSIPLSPTTLRYLCGEPTTLPSASPTLWYVHFSYRLYCKNTKQISQIVNFQTGNLLTFLRWQQERQTSKENFTFAFVIAQYEQTLKSFSRCKM